ncbi:hypothetical protein B0T26DRAFT_611380, partial [Lasiosphaeria miniovina]
AEAIGLKVDPKKTELLYIPPQGRGSQARLPERVVIATAAGPVRPSKSIKWLGIHLDRKLSFANHVRARSTGSGRIAGLAARTNQIARGLPVGASRVFYAAATVPIATYGIPALFPGLRRLGQRG